MLIAEIGNCHMGDWDVAKDMIRVAKESGADLVKGQVIPMGFKGSMPTEFYNRCSFNVNQYLELIEYGKSIGVPVFYSIFDNSVFEQIARQQEYMKFAACQGIDLSLMHDFWIKNWLISINKQSLYANATHLVDTAINCKFMYASGYNESDPHLQNIFALRLHTGRQVGYSDHTKGPEWAKRAISDYGCTVVEKHFVLNRNGYFKGTLFRDFVHGATPDEFEEIAIAMKGK